MIQKGGRIKKGNSKHRGYIGYHTTWDNKKVFLRSKCEFIIARMLDYQREYYLMEKVIYEIKGKRYKPDFFIFDSDYNQIKKIIEVKGWDDIKTANEYLGKYKPYFDKLGIDYEVIWKYQAIATKYNLYDEIDNWINKSVNTYEHVLDIRGDRNPMYGVQHSDKTKQLIGKKASDRHNDPEYKAKCIAATKKAMSRPETRVLLGKQKMYSAIKKYGIHVKVYDSYDQLYETMKQKGILSHKKKVIRYKKYFPHINEFNNFIIEYNGKININ